MELVHAVHVLHDSPFWGRRVPLLARCAPLPTADYRRPRCRARSSSGGGGGGGGGAFVADDSEAQLRRRGERRPGARDPAPRNRGWGEIEENASPRVARERDVVEKMSSTTTTSTTKPAREIARSGARPPWKDGDDAAEKRGGGGGSKIAAKESSRRRREVARAAGPKPEQRASCYGCGAPLQTSDSETAGYIPPHTYELKRKHHQLKTLLCGRCRLLSQGRMIPAVGGVGRCESPNRSVTADQLRAQLSHLRHQNVLVVKLVDIVDFNGSFLGRVRDLVGANPIVLVLTKVDLLPEGTDLGAVSDWLQEAVCRKGLNVLSLHLTSAKAQTGISRVTADITRKRQGRDVYILGSANVGKSAFVTAVLRDLGRRDPVAAAALRFKPVQSAMPGTTLGPIAFEAFMGGGKIYDTPGVHLHHRMAGAVDPQDVALLAPRRRLRGYIVGLAAEPEIEDESEEEGEEFEEPLFKDFDLDAFFMAKSRGQNWWKGNCFEDMDECQKMEERKEDVSLTDGVLTGYSLFWGGITRIDIVKAPERLIFTFYGPPAVRVYIVPSEEADDFYQENVGKKLNPPTENTVGQWCGLEKVQEIHLVAERLSKRPAGDIAISGLGWFAIGKSNVMQDGLESDESEGLASGEGSDESTGLYSEDDEIILVLHTPKNVEMFVRPSIPLGKAAAFWYEYADVPEKEHTLRARPQLFY